jgi:hypothetical protein
MCNYIYHHQSKYVDLDVQIMIHSVIYTNTYFLCLKAAENKYK